MVKEGESVSKLSKQKKAKRLSAGEREELLIDNFVSLQKVMMNLSVKFENLSDNINRLLGVFEMSARDFMVNKGRTNPEKDREVINQINNLMDQNKALARSISMLDEKMKNKPQESLPRQTTMSMPQQQSQTNSPAGYEPSIQNTQFKPKPLQGI
ncbi:hypothetical protein KA107_00885 [Candidatus Pacearchaeota archaeon]|nr:hypothetical protein [Candidatus Pacearchaeota archaeon]